MHCLRKAAPNVLDGARVQGSEPARALRLLLAKAVTGHDAATHCLRRRTAETEHPSEDRHRRYIEICMGWMYPS